MKGLKNSVYFYIGEESLEPLIALGHSPQEAQTLIQDGCWQYIITSMTERHVEAYNLVNPLSDTFSVYTGGAMPIDISCHGYLYTGKTQDHRLDFLNFYLTKLRGTLLARHKLVIVMMAKDTIFRLRARVIQMNTASTMQDWTQLSLQGLGFSYSIKEQSYE